MAPLKLTPVRESRKSKEYHKSSFLWRKVASVGVSAKNMHMVTDRYLRVQPNTNKTRSSTIQNQESRKFVLDTKKHGRRVVNAHLVASGEHAEIWLDDSYYISQALLIQLLSRFDEEIYPRNIEYFASQAAQERAGCVVILITNLGSMDGYFDSGSLSERNHLNLIYLNVDVARNELQEASNTLAHEFEHLLFYLSGGGNIAWLDEGLAVYAEYINGGTPDAYIKSFQHNSNVRLMDTFKNSDSSYGAAFLFIAYAAEQVEQSHRSVPEFTKALIESSGDGLNGINATLHRFISNRQLDSFGEIYQSQQLINYSSKAILKAT